MRVISIGDLVVDYYHMNGNLLGISGGMSSHNIIANLAKRKIKTSVFGVCGNDAQGEIAVKSLKDLGVDVTNILMLDNVETRCFHISYMDNADEITCTSKKRCPICDRKKWYNDSLIDVDKLLLQLNKDDILVFDNLNYKNQEIIDNASNLKLIDLGQFFEFEDLSNEEIINKISNKFKIINLNERVEKYFIKRFELNSSLELIDLFKTDLITVTMGKKGVKFLYNLKMFIYELENVIDEVDSTGAGDAFFSSIIESWLKNDFKFEEDKFLDWYKKSSKLTGKVVRKMGARGHLKALYKIKGNDNCICEDFLFIVRKPVKSCNININNLEKRVINAINSDALNKLNDIGFLSDENYIFTGTGGSFAAAKFASIVINNIYGSNTYAFYPRDIVYRNNSLINKVILFSYSGTTNDLLEGTKNFDVNNKYIFTKGELQKVVLKSGVPKKNIISYRTGTNRGKEKGFLSFEGVIAPAVVFMMYYCLKKDKLFDAEEFIKNSLNYWNEFFDNEFKDKNMKEFFKKGNVINIFKGDYTDCAAYDIESKIIESGFVNCIVHEKKNFSHGRFVNYENLSNKNSIYFKQNTSTSYDNILLEYLKNGNNLIIESRYSGIFCEFDLLVASQLLPYYIGKTFDIDISKPKYTEDAMKLYFYKGSL